MYLRQWVDRPIIIFSRMGNQSSMVNNKKLCSRPLKIPNRLKIFLIWMEIHINPPKNKEQEIVIIIYFKKIIPIVSKI